MSTIIQIKRNSGTTAPTTSDLVIGEMAYAYDASNDGASAKLYIEATNNASAADIHLIGGKYFTDLMDHTLGTTTASSALLVDSSSKLDVINIDNVTINGNDISSTDSNGNLTLTPNGTGIVSINKNDGFKLPVGTTGQRAGSPVAGQIRYNTSLSTFEGYGSAWGSLGGVIDVDQDTKITAESAAGQDEDVLTFYIGVSDSAVSQLILADGVLKPTSDNDIDLGTGSLEFKDAYFDGTVTTDALVADTVDINAGTIDGVTLGTNSPITNAVIDDVAINGKVITMTGSSGDTAALTVGANGTLAITTVDTAAAAANMTLTADGTFEAIGTTVTLDSGGAINLEPAAGSAILLDGTISVDAGVVTGATSITSTAFVGTLDTAAQGNVTSLGTLTALTVDDVAIDGKVVTMTGSSGDTAILTVGTNGTLDITTVDTAAAAANMTLTADGTFEAVGTTITLDSGGAINLEPASGSAILLDGTISVDAGEVTGATSITSTAFVGTLSTAAQGNVTSLGTLTALTVDNVAIDGKVVTMTGSTDDTAVLTVGTNGTLSIVTTDTAAAAANIQITADGTVDIDSTGALTLDSGAAINLEPAAGSVILLDGTISVDAGVVTGATSITSTAFVGNITGDLTGTLQTAAQGNVTSLGTLTGLTVSGSTTLAATSFGDADITNVGDIQLDSITGDGDTNTAITFSGSDVITVSVGGGNQVTFTDGAIVPSSDDDLDLGTGSAEFKDLYLDGTAYIDTLVVDSVGIDGGTVDGVTIGSNAVATILSVDNLRLDGNTFSSTNSNGDITIAPNGTGNVITSTDTLQVAAAASEQANLVVTGGEAAAGRVAIQADDGDDASDTWDIVTATGGTLSIGNDIASKGTSVAQLVLTPHATVASSTTAVVGALTVAGATTFSGTVDMNSQATTNVNIDSGAIDGVTLGSNAVITTATIDDININGQTISTTASNNNIILTPHGTGDVAINSDTLSVTGTEGESASLMLIADESDDASDDWAITANTNGTLQISNDIASAGTQVAFLTLTPHATVASSTLAALGNVTIAGNLTVSGATTSVSSTNTTITDKLIELATGSTGSASGDVGHVFERGDDANIFIGWDESADTFIAATGTFTGATTGNVSIASYAAAKFGSLTLTTDLAVAEGGTGVSSFTDKGIVYGDGASALDVTAAPGGADVTTSFQILTAGSGNGNPVWTTTIDGGTY